MKSLFLTQLFTDTSITAIGLLIFFVWFLGLCAWVFLRKGAFREYEALAQFPLREDGEQS